MERNKTEVLSFYDTLNKHKRLLTESLINFDEGQRVRKIMLDIDSNSADYEYYFQSGQQSKQVEVDKLQTEIDELQERIDEVIYDLQHIESVMWEEQVEHVLMILKGDQA